MKQRSELIEEINIELAMRRKVWKKASTKPLQFVAIDHNKRYRRLQEMKSLLEVMTPEEYKTIMKRSMQARKQAEQSKLFGK